MTVQDISLFENIRRTRLLARVLRRVREYHRVAGRERLFGTIVENDEARALRAAVSAELSAAHGAVTGAGISPCIPFIPRKGLEGPPGEVDAVNNALNTDTFGIPPEQVFAIFERAIAAYRAVRGRALLRSLLLRGNTRLL